MLTTSLMYRATDSVSPVSMETLKPSCFCRMDTNCTLSGRTSSIIDITSITSSSTATSRHTVLPASWMKLSMRASCALVAYAVPPCFSRMRSLPISQYFQTPLICAQPLTPTPSITCTLRIGGKTLSPSAIHPRKSDTMALARGCELFSSIAAAHAMAASASSAVSASTSLPTTLKNPRVKVPVLSRATESTSPMRSTTEDPRINTP
mmetsp:Transcript_62290/g.109747  ORF Transcript_62290/g.109747 Transcript_62290/m.109747 type:complete len:207 (-) Transcript_62290:528-1148(-)